MPIRENDPRKLEDWMVKIERRLRALESRRIDAGPGLERDYATKEIHTKISNEPGNATTIGEDGGIKSSDTITSAADHAPLYIQKFTTAGTNIPTGGPDTLVSWGSESSSGVWTSSSTTITIPEDGLYHVNVVWPWANNVVGVRALHVTLNSTSVIAGSTMASTIDPEEGEPINVLSDYRVFVAGDLLRVYVFQNSGAVVVGGAPYFGDVRGRWTVTKWGDAFPPELTQTTI